jgi:hypothetical protein
LTRLFVQEDNIRASELIGNNTVTLYTTDTTNDVCSGLAVGDIHIATCYNTTFVYYSIDFCDAGAAQSSPALSSVSSAAATSSSSADAVTGKSSSHLGAILGGVIGGILGLCVIVGATVYITRRNMTERRAGKIVEMDGAAHGSSNMGEISEMGTGVEYAKEMPTNEGTVIYEKMAHEPELPPVELPAAELDKHSGRTATPQR